VDIIIDGTKQRTSRITEAEKQRSPIAEKTSRVNNNLIVAVEEWLVRYLNNTYPGSGHDSRIYDEEA
jgi:hypothetical protein